MLSLFFVACELVLRFKIGLYSVAFLLWANEDHPSFLYKSTSKLKGSIYIWRTGVKEGKENGLKPIYEGAIFLRLQKS